MKFDSAFSAPPVTVATNLSSPADIFYNTLGDTLAIPNSGNNTVTFIGFPSTVGIHQIENKTNCLLYPNPVTAGKTFHLAFKKDFKGNIELFSVQGQRIFSTDTEEEFFSNAEFSFPGFSNLKAGIYFIRITSTEFRESKILVIEH
ncbi:MAG: T9SS type A sorting domain-containing protein [Bacteroidetes bacterium]|nr:T9SS type A sorting domain-containing protein [Bacteroidota bacterium]